MVRAPKEVHTFGSRFSRDVRGIFVNPREAVKMIIDEAELPHSLSVPIAVVVVAAVMGVFGNYLWKDVLMTLTGAPMWYQVVASIVRGFLFMFELIVRPIIFVIWALFLAVVFHFLGSIVSGADIAEGNILHRTIKLTCFAFVPLFLNILPVFPEITGYWSVWIAYIAMKENYKTTRAGAFIIILPYFFVVALGTMKLIINLLSA